MKTFLFFGILIIFVNSIFAQVDCTSNSVFTEKKCVGDEISPAEKELIRIINDYRAANKLPMVSISESLSFVANRHLLDLINNVKTFTHGWSNCPFDIKNDKTWDCVFEAPNRLNSNYTGTGYENLYRNLTGNATAGLALDAWKKSPPHNGLILNLDVWKNKKFDAFGVAISGNYACMWFGVIGGGQINSKPTKGLGVSFDKAVQGLTSILSIKKESSLIDSEIWVGKSPDKSITLEIYGKQEDISETTMAFSIKLEKNLRLSEKNRAVLSTFLQNLTTNWVEREKWIDATMAVLSKNRQAVRTVNVQNKTIEVKINAASSLTLIVKPFEKPKAKEL